MKKVVAFLLIVFFFSTPSCPVLALTGDAVSVEEMEADGADVIVNEDIALARNNAIKDSLRKTVEMAVGGLISSEDIARHFERINNTIYSKSQHYIQNYRIVEESIDDNLYTVHIKAAVSVGTIKGDLETLGLLVMAGDLPRVMILIGTENSEGQYPDYRLNSAEPSLWEETMGIALMEKGFVVIDRSHLFTMGEYEASTMDMTSVRVMGRGVGADLVIIGSSQSRQADTIAGTGVKELQARVTARAVIVDTGAVIASDSGYAESFNIEKEKGEEEAIRKAAEQLSERLHARIMTQWQKQAAATTMVSMTVTGIESYSDFVTLREVLTSALKGVKNIYQRRMEWGMATFDIEITGGTKVLADQLSTRGFKYFSLGIIDITENSIVMNIRK